LAGALKCTPGGVNMVLLSHLQLIKRYTSAKALHTRERREYL